MLKYVSNPKHESPGARGRKGARLDLTATEARLLLNDHARCVQLPGRPERIGVRNGKIYVFRGDPAAGYHAYPISGNEFCEKFHCVIPQVARLLGTDPKRLSRMK